MTKKDLNDFHENFEGFSQVLSRLAAPTTPYSTWCGFRPESLRLRQEPSCSSERSPCSRSPRVRPAIRQASPQRGIPPHRRPYRPCCPLLAVTRKFQQRRSA